MLVWFEGRQRMYVRRWSGRLRTGAFADGSGRGIVGQSRMYKGQHDESTRWKASPTYDMYLMLGEARRLGDWGNPGVGSERSDRA